MTTGGSFREDTRAELLARLLDAARELTTAQGWSAVTMGAVASRAGISRQHLYNAVGTKAALGDALVGRETDAFLAVVCGELRAHPDDLVAGSVAGVAAALAFGASNDLLKAILTADGGESLLPVVTASPEVVLERGVGVVAAQLAALHGEDPDLSVLADGLVRLVISHATQPTGPDLAATQARWLAEGLARRC
ncbi:TetR family transcriptional regulator [Actinomycetospora sp. NBRC 106378]|uniref:TetR family transcriptional regulator n=1 Tax=Actinomycetospora sp. NBRC 106378 TaxID=3032208 RepID=UPI0024A2CFBA|nr:TetR family transcriptional regulator [Actinomycetospora sp. NBRC 106378]GLZ55557.1 TetR family transcriptional regulator [Actinomycetospora sp. NBRC 106378]